MSRALMVVRKAKVCLNCNEQGLHGSSEGKNPFNCNEESPHDSSEAESLFELQ
jgi:hypothetical protein